MVVKQRQQQRPRPPSPTLWAIVRKISDAHWQRLKDYSQKFGKKSMYFRLFELLRAMPVYDPVAEKNEFSSVKLHSMRNVARKWLVRAAIKLDLHVEQVEGDVVSVDVLTQWGCFDEALDLIENARAIAKGQRDHAKLTRLYEQEMVVARMIYEGNERIERMSQLATLAIESSKMHSVEAEIRNQTVLHIEIQKLRFETTGAFDIQATERYFNSDFYKRKIDQWPVLFQLEKLHIDESNHIYRLDVKKVIQVASKILDIFNTNPKIREARAKDHARILFRLCVSGTNDNLERSREALEAYRAVQPLAQENREAYIGFFLYALFKVGYDTCDMALGAEGAMVWEAHKDYLLSLKVDNMSINTMLCTCSYYIAIGSISNARDVFNLLFKIQDSIQPIWAQAVYSMFHIIILLEEDDDIELKGLQSYSKRYKRELKGLPAAVLGLAIIKCLCKPKHNFKPKSLLKALPKVLEMLMQHQNSEEVSYKPFLYPIIHWAKRKIGSLK